jgi:hypothetical protein
MRNNARIHSSIALNHSKPFTAAAIDARDDSLHPSSSSM